MYARWGCTGESAAKWRYENNSVSIKTHECMWIRNLFMYLFYCFSKTWSRSLSFMTDGRLGVLRVFECSDRFFTFCVWWAFNGFCDVWTVRLLSNWRTELIERRGEEPQKCLLWVVSFDSLCAFFLFSFHIHFFLTSNHFCEWEVFI